MSGDKGRQARCLQDVKQCLRALMSVSRVHHSLPVKVYTPDVCKFVRFELSRFKGLRLSISVDNSFIDEVKL